MKGGAGHMGVWGRGTIIKGHRTLKLKEEYIYQGQAKNMTYISIIWGRFNIREMSIKVWEGIRKSQGIGKCPGLRPVEFAYLHALRRREWVICHQDPEAKGLEGEGCLTGTVIKELTSLQLARQWNYHPELTLLPSLMSGCCSPLMESNWTPKIIEMVGE